MLCASASALVACGLFEAPAKPPAPPAPKPPVVQVEAPRPKPAFQGPAPELAKPSDIVARNLAAYWDRISALAPPDLAAEVGRLGAQVSPTNSVSKPDDALDLALALAQQHNPGDLTLAMDLLDPIVHATTPDMQAWQPMARLLSGRIAEEMRLEDLMDRQGAQHRDMQRAIQQLTEKLEALKAIERSMTPRPSTPAPPAAAPGGGGAPPSAGRVP